MVRPADSSQPFTVLLDTPLGAEAKFEKAQKKKEAAVKASFKIEINDEEKQARDSTQTNLYHTGTPIIMDENDREEFEADQLRKIEEEGGRESSDDGDDDDDEDPDEDLDF